MKLCLKIILGVVIAIGAVLLIGLQGCNNDDPQQHIFGPGLVNPDCA